MGLLITISISISILIAKQHLTKMHTCFKKTRAFSYQIFLDFEEKYSQKNCDSV